MLIYDNITSLQHQISLEKNNDNTIAFVPTMGNLHAGHLQLIQSAKEVAKIVICSIFVNVLQFGENEDFSSYPRTLDDDLKKLKALKCDIVFIPPSDLLTPLPKADHVTISIPNLSTLHCGKTRPVFFDGIATIVTKFFNIIQPNFAIFGEKDFQQLLLIKKIVNGLFLNITIISVPTIRNDEGLALSSRNNYLSPSQQHQASIIYRTLVELKTEIEQHKVHDFQSLQIQAIKKIEMGGLTVDYLSICHQNTLQPATAADKQLIILTACYLNDVRLIDNIKIK